MKHPVDTSAWGEFVVGELFDVQLSDGDNKPKKLPKGNIPLVSAGNTNNGIVGSFESDTIIFPAHSITVDMFGQAFYQPKEFQAVSHGRVNILVPNFENNENIGQFIVTILNAQCQKYSFTEMLTSKKIKAESIKLPLKPSADPSNYDSTDIDWDYMDTVMSRVTVRAKDRLANLPQPTNKKKTPVDTSTWGEFVVGELFDMIQGRRLKKADFIEGDIPYVMARSYNNGVITYISNPITTGENLLTADIFGNVFYQSSFIGFGDDNCGLKLKNHKATKYQYLFLATVFKKFQNEASFTNKLRGSWYIQQTFPLPLKPSADPSNYTQEDIDWDYMDHFMQAIEEKAHERLVELNAYMNEDD